VEVSVVVQVPYTGTSLWNDVDYDQSQHLAGIQLINYCIVVSWRANILANRVIRACFVPAINLNNMQHTTHTCTSECG